MELQNPWLKSPSPKYLNGFMTPKCLDKKHPLWSQRDSFSAGGNAPVAAEVSRENVCMYVCMYVCMDGWMDGWVDGCKNVCIYKIIFIVYKYIYIMYISYIPHPWSNPALNYPSFLTPKHHMGGRTARSRAKCSSNCKDLEMGWKFSAAKWWNDGITVPKMWFQQPQNHDYHDFWCFTWILFYSCRERKRGKKNNLFIEYDGKKDRKLL